MDVNEVGEKVAIAFSKEESIVFFEWLATINAQDRPELFSDQAEQRVLWDLECCFETVLVEPFWDNWLGVVASARKKVRDTEDET